MQDKIEAFLKLFQEESEWHLIHVNNCGLLVQDAKEKGRPTYKEMKAEELGKFYRVFEWNGTQRCARYFIEKETGIIYGTDSWKKPNFKRAYGTLDTINDWRWGAYYALSKTGKSTLVPKDQRRTGAGRKVLSVNA